MHKTDVIFCLVMIVVVMIGSFAGSLLARAVIGML